MRVLFFTLSILLLGFTSCKKDDATESLPSITGTWELVQTATTHELGHIDNYTPFDKIVDTRVTTTVDHQKEYEVLEISNASMTWTDLSLETKLYNWTYDNNVFTLTGTDTTLAYRVTELTYDSFVFFIKDQRIYNDSTNLVAYEEYHDVYNLNKVD